MGRATQRQRIWADGSQVTVDQGFDLEGRPQWTLTPSGRLIEAVRDAGFTTDLLHSTSSSNATLLVEADWDSYGRSKGWRSRSGVTVRASHSAFGELDAISIRGASTTLASRLYQWQDNGLALSVDEGAGPNLYSYDDRMQLVGVVGPWTEAFGFLPGGDLATQTTPSGQAWTWTPPAGHHKPTRRGSGARLESFTWDNAGRLETWADGAHLWEFLYDGLSRLRAVNRDGQLALVLERDTKGQIIRRVEGIPTDPSAPVEQAFAGWRKTTSGAIHEDIRVDGMLVGFFEDGQARWVMPEPGGAVAAVVDDRGTLLSSRTRSAFGATRSATGAQDAPGFHGHREELGGLPLIDAEARHLLVGLGMWLQPEPLLLERPQGLILEDPLRLHPYRYARNSPTSFHDPDGRAADAIVDFGSIVYDLYTIWNDPYDSTNWLALGADVVGLALPVGTGLGASVRTARSADDVVDAANAVGRIASHGDEAAEAAVRTADEAAQLAPYGGTGGGHHVPAKSAFRGADNYDINKALAIPNAELARLGVKHSSVTTAQMQGYRAFASTGQDLTWEAVARIETAALVGGGMSRSTAEATVKQAVEALQQAGVPGPTRIPWGP